MNKAAKCMISMRRSGGGGVHILVCLCVCARARACVCLLYVLVVCDSAARDHHMLEHVCVCVCLYVSLVHKLV